MNGEGRAPRFAASAFPEIQAIRLMPGASEATLVNLSSSGILVECASRVPPGTLMNVEFTGGFTPAAVAGRVIRCEVKGISSDAGLRFHIGLAFIRPIPLPGDRPSHADSPAPAQPWPPAAAEPPATAAPAMIQPAAPPVPQEPSVPRNRW